MVVAPTLLIDICKYYMIPNSFLKWALYFGHVLNCSGPHQKKTRSQTSRQALKSFSQSSALRALHIDPVCQQ